MSPFSSAGEVSFRSVPDKARQNSGGGSCVRVEPGSIEMKYGHCRYEVRALSVTDFWREKGLTKCDLMKLDCEGAEFQILQALATVGLLKGVRQIVGEWHALDGKKDAPARARAELTEILRQTHRLQFHSDRPGAEGSFSFPPAGKGEIVNIQSYNMYDVPFSCLLFLPLNSRL